MKSKTIASTYSLNKREFEDFVRQSPYLYRDTMTGIDIDDSQNIEAIVEAFWEFERHQEKLQRTQLEEKKMREEHKRQALANMLITSGFSFDGHTIVKYSGYISGDDAIEVPRGSVGFIFNTATNVADSLMASLVKIRRNALAELKEAAYDLGCNAVIGVDFDYITLDPETSNSSGGTTYLPYVFGVTANGNAVIIEKNTPTDQD